MIWQQRKRDLTCSHCQYENSGIHEFVLRTRRTDFDPYSLSSLPQVCSRSPYFLIVKDPLPLRSEGLLHSLPQVSAQWGFVHLTNDFQMGDLTDFLPSPCRQIVHFEIAEISAVFGPTQGYCILSSVTILIRKWDSVYRRDGGARGRTPSIDREKSDV